MTGEWFFERSGRKIIVTGHYGSGKTEFAVSLALLLSTRIAEKRAMTRQSESMAGSTEFPPSKLTSKKLSPKAFTSVALIDLDIVNPYFRSRERRGLLEAAGVSVFGSVYSKEVTAELPALGASLRGPLEDDHCRVIVDAGGNDSGALVLNQFSKYFTDDETTILAVVNANRPETNNIDGALRHIAAIEAATGLNITGIVNNCHLTRETTADAVITGHELCVKVCEATGKQLWCDCYPDGIVAAEDLSGISGNLMPLGLYMRPTWLDK
jgi:energy-coupling factor transporter ATP-binding protein EcfA2